MILTFVLPVQARTVPLVPFVDDGMTKTHEAPPLLLPIVGQGAKRGATVRVGGRAIRLLVVDGKGGRALFADRNGNGRGEKDERVPLARLGAKGPDGSPLTMYRGKLAFPGNVRFDVRMFVSATKDPGFAGLRNKVALLPLSGYIGTAQFGPKRLRFGIRGADLSSGALFIDRDGDGTLGTVEQEMFALNKPFNLNGTTYEATSLSTAGRPSVTFSMSAKRVPVTFMPPNLSVGRVAPPLSGTSLTGSKVSFPSGYKGKLVMFDVWATWCGPCVGEIPYMRAAYARYKRRGFEIVSFNVDDPGRKAKVAAFAKAKGISWPMVYEGKGWSSPVALRYNIHSLPFCLLVDGSTGKILARDIDLRGPYLASTLEGQLSMRGR